MQYNKQWISFEDQANKLISRGLIADKGKLVKVLQSVNYYRFTGYLYPFRQKNSENFLSDITLEKIWDLYKFDRRLRIILLEAIERIEISFRTQVVYLFAEKCGTFGYLKKSNFPNLTSKEYKNLIKGIRKETFRKRGKSSKSKENFVVNFFNKYGRKHNDLPIWILIEIVSFGTTHTLFKGLPDELIKKIASHYKIADKLLLSWIRSLHSMRNICAHHSILFNRVLGYKPLIPAKNKFPKWHNPTTVSNQKVFSIIMICNYFMQEIASQSKWKYRLNELANEFPSIELGAYGFPTNWEDFLK